MKMERGLLGVTGHKGEGTGKKRNRETARKELHLKNAVMKPLLSWRQLLVGRGEIRDKEKSRYKQPTGEGGIWIQGSEDTACRGAGTVVGAFSVAVCAAQ